MKKWTLLLFLLIGCFSQKVKAQEMEVQQLLLNVEKLAQLKNILEDMKKGYEIVSKGYGTIKDLSEGNFKLHQEFLEGLLQVSPGVKQYYKVGSIVAMQIRLVKSYKEAFQKFKQSGQFTLGELAHMGKVYNRLFEKSVQNLDALLIVITSGSLRMTDEERLEAIDAIHTEIEAQFGFLQHFNKGNRMLALQRIKDAFDQKATRSLYGLNK